MQEQIFISYRRSDASDKARLLRFFIKECGRTAFLDTEIERSEAFPNQLEEKIKNSDDFILVISKETSNYKGTNEREDWLFKEMKIAYESNKKTGSPRLHMASINKEALNAFIEMRAPNEEFREALAHFQKITNDPEILDYAENSDTMILNKISTSLNKSFVARNKSLLIDKSVQTKYNPHESKTEYDRLKKQAINSYKQDKIFIKRITDTLLAREDSKPTLKVLDVGCAQGVAGEIYFQNDVNKDIFEKIVGIDINAEPVQVAAERNKNNPKFTYAQIDIAGEDADEKLEALMKQTCGNDKFDIIFCCQVLHHIPQRREAIDRLKKCLNPGGCMIIRGSDDGTKMVFRPENNGADQQIIDEIVYLTTEPIKTVSDRKYGRKIYSDLCRAGFYEIQVHPIANSPAAHEDKDKRQKALQYYHGSFSWRKEIFEPREGDNKSRKAELAKLKERMKAETDKMENILTAGGCWYMELDFLGWGFYQGEE